MRAEPAPCNEESHRRQEHVNDDVRGFIAAGVHDGCAQPWPKRTSMCLGTSSFIDPLPTNVAANAPAAIHSA